MLQFENKVTWTSLSPPQRHIPKYKTAMTPINAGETLKIY